MHKEYRVKNTTQRIRGEEHGTKNTRIKSNAQ
jgi:hypothetical protein